MNPRHRRVAFPPPMRWPDAGTTGPRIALSAPEAGITITVNNTVVIGRSFTDQLEIQADNVTISDCKMSHGDSYGVLVTSGSGAVIKYCEISGPGNGIGGAGAFIHHNDISQAQNAVVMWEPSTIEHNYLHNFFFTDDPHYDGVELNGGFSNVIVRHNSVLLDQDQTSAVMINNNEGAMTNVLVEHNLITGGAYTIFTDYRFTATPVDNIRFINNRLGSGEFGYVTFWEGVTNGVFTGNRDYVTGDTVVP